RAAEIILGGSDLLPPRALGRRGGGRALGLGRLAGALEDRRGSRRLRAWEGSKPEQEEDVVHGREVGEPVAQALQPEALLALDLALRRDPDERVVERLQAALGEAAEPLHLGRRELVRRLVGVAGNEAVAPGGDARAGLGREAARLGRAPA